MKIPEKNIQEAVVQFVRCQRHPASELIFAIPNQLSQKVQNRGVLQSRAMSGVSTGVPDLMIAWPSGPWHGLFLELKAEGGRLSVAQESWLGRLKGQGYRAEVAYGLEGALAVVREYLGV